MRSDMFKVIVERPRRGAGFRMNRARLAGADDLPARVGMKKFRRLNRTDSKYLNENLAPLRRYLMKQAGRPWSKVYSEICENLDAGHTVKQHVRDHLKDFVVLKVAVGRDGEWMNGNASHWGAASPPWPQPLYVDPHDGILKRSDRLWKKLRIDPTPGWLQPRREESATDPNIRHIDRNTELRCIDGIWYEVTFARLLDENAAPPVHDKLTHQPVQQGQRYAASKIQLSRARLSALDLANKPAV
ncbi:hypothetical protein [Hyphococcus sp.]|jgi:hypothetical protein|uniref:hypothetical protein n=1 Tax=Hyphococcus sp. TaxID=2038636 RepID=UPI003D1365DF